MPTEARSSSYCWPTWVVGLMSGEKHCEWAAWFKSHFKYDKRPDPDEGKRLKWKAAHSLLVSARMGLLEAEGWEVWIEDQNRFTYHGEVAVVGGCPDLIVRRGSVVRIEDGKTGQERDSDVYQVLLYMMIAPRMHKARFRDADPPSGLLVYPERTRDVPASALEVHKPDIVRWVKRVAGAVEPMRRPSPSECRWCDIACCPERKPDDGAQEPEVNPVF